MGFHICDMICQVFCAHTCGYCVVTRCLCWYLNWFTDFVRGRSCKLFIYISFTINGGVWAGGWIMFKSRGFFWGGINYRSIAQFTKNDWVLTPYANWQIDTKQLCRVLYHGLYRVPPYSWNINGIPFLMQPNKNQLMVLLSQNCLLYPGVNDHQLI